MSKLVELIVVLVILAILMAVLIPALLGYIDKARESQISTNANAILVAAQSLADEDYGTIPSSDPATYITKAKIEKLTGIAASKMTTLKLSFTTDTFVGSTPTKEMFQISQFTYTENGITVVWSSTTGKFDTAGTDAATHAIS